MSYIMVISKILNRIKSVKRFERSDEIRQRILNKLLLKSILRVPFSSTMIIMIYDYEKGVFDREIKELNFRKTYKKCYWENYNERKRMVYTLKLY